MRFLQMIFAALLLASSAYAELRAGVATVSITPLEAGIPTQLGGYGDRAGKPAEGIHDTITAKALVFDYEEIKSALITVDTCSIPLGVVEESLEKAAIVGLTVDRTVIAASHTHAGIEGFALDRRNIAGSPHIGIFSAELLDFVTDRIAHALGEAEAALQPVTAGAGRTRLAGMNRNRRGSDCIDEDMTILRLDRVDGTPYVVLVNYTAHPTIMSAKEMLISGGWPGVMQRTIEAVLGEDVTCMFTNGAVGDMSPTGATGGSNWERAENYGRRIGLEAAALAQRINTHRVDRFALHSLWVELPPQQAAPDFVNIAGAEYHITEEQLEQLLPVMFPDKAPLYALRINNFALLTFPGEPICEVGYQAKHAMASAGIAYPCVAALTNDHIGYILTPTEYNKGGYEVTVSFYGETLGELLIEHIGELTKKITE